MSEAPVAVTDGWTDRKRETTGGRRVSRGGSRSLKDALSEAGLGESPRREVITPRKPPASSWSAPALREALDSVSTASRETPPPQPAAQLALVEEVAPLISSASRAGAAHGVVSPPPWLRAARRGRWQARFFNAFGWLVTIVVAGTIISVAGRYLAVPPTEQSVYSARQ